MITDDLCEACQADRHEDCDGNLWDPNLDDWRPCQCPEEEHDA